MTVATATKSLNLLSPRVATEDKPMRMDGDHRMAAITEIRVDDGLANISPKEIVDVVTRVVMPMRPKEARTGEAYGMKH
jgi:hypothetical protein